jgi:hypothetical protein
MHLATRFHAFTRWMPRRPGVPGRGAKNFRAGYWLLVAASSEM